MDNLSVILRYCRNFTEKRLKEFDLTFGEQMTLLFLSKNDNVNQDTISKKFMIDKGMVAKTLNKLEEKAFIMREQNPYNKRENIISLTEKGASIIDNIRTVFDEWNKILFEGISEEEKDYFRKIIGKMAKNITNYME
ncbi:MAG: MarR family transcriptional regulator [Clostridium sp.]|uniref:MarR family winged helix-turn-helix transcriptional regulator n=1 Tax=Clostridium sp. TaxID=1506 RepID=UPI0025C45053|nr:MarR family transcriptional regulator [Clostridium sp.]MCF0147549.1 MarR family transcriptional regulator [Clostridium sp.]